MFASLAIRYRLGINMHERETVRLADDNRTTITVDRRFGYFWVKLKWLSVRGFDCNASIGLIIPSIISNFRKMVKISDIIHRYWYFQFFKEKPVGKSYEETRKKKYIRETASFLFNF